MSGNSGHGRTTCDVDPDRPISAMLWTGSKTPERRVGQVGACYPYYANSIHQHATGADVSTDDGCRQSVKTHPNGWFQVRRIKYLVTTGQNRLIKINPWSSNGDYNAMSGANYEPNDDHKLYVNDPVSIDCPISRQFRLNIATQSLGHDSCDHRYACKICTDFITYIAINCRDKFLIKNGKCFKIKRTAPHSRHS